MKLKKYLWILLTLMYFDLVFNLCMYDSYQRMSVINIFLFELLDASLIYLITSIWSKKANQVVSYFVYGFKWFWYSLYYVFYQVLLTPFSMALLRQTDQVLKFGGNVVIAIIQNFHLIVLNFLPLLMLIVFRKKFHFERLNLRGILIAVGLFLGTFIIYIVNIFVQDKEIGSIYNLYFENNNVSLNIEKLGVSASTYIDAYRFIFGINEKIETVTNHYEEKEETVFEYNYNTKNLNFDFGSGDISTINNFMKNEVGSKQNKYTGIFEGMNLIYIVAESFSEIAVSEEFTPTIYKLVHDGLYFENFYTSNNLSTIGGEFQALTGLYADNMILSNWRNGTSYYPNGLGNIFKNEGYNVFAYHGHDAYFQDRNIYLKTQGFDNYKGCYNGLEKVINCNQWPESDLEMMQGTVSDYINSDEPFMAYYMTISGHMHYNFVGNAIASKNRHLVDDLDYPEEVKGYIATQIELDKALEYLLGELEKAGKLDNTVIVMLADHYPYDLSLEHINILSSYQRDSLIETNSNNLIIYNSKLKSETISKVGMSIDVIPTVYNMFGVDYDSRLIMGKDILSTAPGIAIFKDKSWITNKGTYYASSGKFESTEEGVPEGYVDDINRIVNNRVAISRMIVDNNYYKYLFDNQ